jgi:transaldolase
MNPLQEIGKLGQSVWLDNLSRTLLREGGLKKLVTEDGVSGVTSNPNIFQKAISESPYYRNDLLELKNSALTPEQRYESLAIPDIREACDLLRPVYERTAGDDGYVSLEVSPGLAHDEAGSIAAGRRLWQTVDRANLLIKMPATPAGIRAFEALIMAGINVNVTLMFSLHHVAEVAMTYIRAIQQRVGCGEDVRHIKAVASLFLSRVDTLVDKRLEALATEAVSGMRGQTGVFLAKLAYQRYKDFFHGDLFAKARAAGARPQYMLWASTGTKNPNYSDVMYLEPLIGPRTVNTVPDATLAAFRDHGRAHLTLEQKIPEAEAYFVSLKRMGIDMHAVGEQLQVEGVKLFQDAFDKLLQEVSSQTGQVVNA